MAVLPRRSRGRRGALPRARRGARRWAAGDSRAGLLAERLLHALVDLDGVVVVGDGGVALGAGAGGVGALERVGARLVELAGDVVQVGAEEAVAAGGGEPLVDDAAGLVEAAAAELELGETGAGVEEGLLALGRAGGEADGEDLAQRR